MALSAAFVRDLNAQTSIEKGELSKPLRQHIKREVGGLEDFGVGEEGDPGSSGFGRADFFEIAHRNAALIGLSPDFAFSLDLDLETLGKSIYHGNTDTMETAGDLIGRIAELAAGMERCENNFGCGPAFGGMDSNGNTATIIRYRDTAVLVNRNYDDLAEATHGFIDGIVHYLVDEVM
jgi:hypothetical protein